jgi:hypothetical protein
MPGLRDPAGCVTAQAPTGGAANEVVALAHELLREGRRFEMAVKERSPCDRRDAPEHTRTLA